MSGADQSAQDASTGLFGGASCAVAVQASSRPTVLSRDQYVEGILRGERSILSRAITLVESARGGDRAVAEEVVEACLPYSGNALRVGITGVPGAGKSTLIEALGQHVVRECGQSVAVLAIDPTSQVTGGSILGDKTRMVSLAASDKAFIRPSPSRGSFGGVAQRTREAMLLCEAAGYQTVLVETVGVGQAETAVHEMVDFLLLMMLAGGGDELQGLKRGVMEVADMIAVNKADGENERAADKTRADAEIALQFFARREWGWRPRALTCSALTGRGVAELWDGVRAFAEMGKATGWIERNRRDQRRRWLRTALEQGLAEMFRSHALVREQIAFYEREVQEGRTTPYQAARKLLDIYAMAGRMA